jgi:hypothetical protein
MRGSRHVRRLVGVVAAGALTLATLVGAASSAEAHGRHHPPGAAQSAVTVTATVDGSDAAVHVAVHVPRALIRGAACTVDGDAVTCGRPHATGLLRSAYDVSLSGLADGEHTFAIAVRLWLPHGHHTLRGSTTFTTGPPPQVVACEAVGGTYADTYLGQRFAQSCSKEYGSPQEAIDNLFPLMNVFNPQCPAQSATDGVVLGNVATALCSSGLALAMRDYCLAQGAGGTLSINGLTCLDRGLPPNALARIRSYCTQLDGVYTEEPFEGIVRIRCDAKV